MTFVGYCFKDHLDALPFAVVYGQGAEFDYAKSLAKRLKAYIFFGYIEKAESSGKTVLYNSAAVINREGDPILNTRKTHLYTADELWA
jgi:protein N-terminal amidase